MSGPPIGFRPSPQQLLSDQRVRRGGCYTASLVVEIRGELERSALAAALDALLERHEILRTRCEGRPAEAAPAQYIEAPGSGVLDAEDADAPLQVTLEAGGPGEWTLRVAAPATVADVATLDAVLAALHGAPTPAGGDDEEPLQYADLAEWLHELRDDDGADPRAEWTRELRRAVEVRLPFERVADAGFTPERIPLALESETLCRLASRAAGDEPSAAGALAAAFAATLSRYVPGAGLEIAATHDGREIEELAGALGPLVKVLPVRCSPAPGESFDDFTRRLSAQLWELPALWELFEWSDEPGLPFAPFVFEWLPASPERAARGATWRVVERYAHTDQFTLKLSVSESDGCVEGSLWFDADRIDPRDARGIAESLAVLARDAARRPHTPIERLALLADADAEAVVETLHRRKTSRPAPQATAHSLFERQASHHPERTAIVCGERALDYAELERRSRRVAAALQSRGVGPDVRVGLLGGRSLETVVSMLAVLRAGGAYVPLDPSQPATRLAATLEESGAPFLLRAGEAPLDVEACPVEAFDVEELEAEADDDATLAREVAARHLAYVLFTSGSTGRPKGVAIEHRQLAAYLEGVADALALPEGASAATVSTFAADLGNTAIYAALCRGGTLHVLEESCLVDAEAFAAYAREHAVDVLKITPSHLEALLSGARARDILPRRCLVMGGETLHWRLVDRIRALGGDCRVFNHYGPTEATVGVAVHEVGPDTPRHTASVPLGTPLCHARVYVVDDEGRPVPFWVPGEIHIGGAQVARGYLKSESDARFAADAFADDPEARVYHSGDVGRTLPEGGVEFLGRRDHQVKIRGFRVELGEIEAALRKLDAVSDAIVQLDGMGRERALRAYVVSNAETPPTAADLRERLEAELPSYMVPAAIAVVDVFPLTPNGKVDRIALAAIGQEATERAPFVAPRDEIEALMAKVWAETLGLERIGVHDDFFEIGGDSILSIQAIAKLADSGLRRSPRQLLEHPTISELATLAAPAETLRDEADLQGEVPLSPPQRELLERELPNPNFFNLPLLVAWRGPVEPALLERALSAVAGHHETLRLRYRRDRGGWQQSYGDGSDTCAWSTSDLSALPEGAREAALEDACAQLSARLDIERGPLLRGHFFDLGGEQGRLFLVVHHLVTDGVSQRILIEDWIQAYLQLRAGEAVRLPEPSSPFACWSRRLAELSPSGVADSELALWRELAGGHVAPLPRDVRLEPRAPLEASRRIVYGAIDREATRALLERAPRTLGVRIEEVITAAAFRVLARWSGAAALRLDVNRHGREELFEDVDLSRAIGWFSGVVPLRVEVVAEESVVDLAVRIRDRLARVPRGGVGYGLLGAEGARSSGIQPAEVQVDYLGQIDQGLLETGFLAPAYESPGPLRDPSTPRRHTFVLRIAIADGRLQCHWEYSADQYRGDTIERLSAEFVEALRAVARSDEGKR